MKDNNIKKFPIGLNNKQCIGPCYAPGTFILHPITLNSITDKEKPFCPTFNWYDETSNVYKDIDNCLIPSSKDEINQYQTDLSFTVPTFYFNCEFFLKSYYDIYSFENVIEWINSKSQPLYSQLRVLNCAWKIFGSKIDIIDDIIVEFYINVVKKEWIKNLYPKIANYITVENDNIYIKKNNLEPSYKQIERINYIFKKIINKQMMFKILQNFIETNKSNWTEINSFNKEIEVDITNYIINKLEQTTK